jgi:hypothetical protein
MPRLFPLFALTAMLAAAAPLFAQDTVSRHTLIVHAQIGPLEGSPLLPPIVHRLPVNWAPIPNVCSGECTLDLQYAAQMQSQTAFLRVFLPDDAFGLPLPDRLATAPIPDLTGWRTRLSELGETSEQDVNKPRQDSDFPFRRDSNQTQVFNIAIGTQF